MNVSTTAKSGAGRMLMAFGLLVSAALTTACGRSESLANTGKTAALKTMTVAMASEPEWLNPVAGHQHPDSDMVLFRGLFKLDKYNHVVPDMAKDWHVSADGLEYTIALRPNIKWHDGVPFTGDDVKFTIEAILDPKNSSGTRKLIEEVKQVEVVDPLTVRIILQRPLAALPSKLKIGMIPRHRLEGKDFNTDPFNFESPVGTGPFRFKEWKRGEYMVLEANLDYYDGRPKLDRLIYKFIPDPNVRLVQLKNGELDIAEIKPKQVEALSKSGDFNIHAVNSTDYRAMMTNHRFPVFRDARVRQALQYATDRKSLIDGALLGYGVPAYGPLQMHEISAPDMPRHDNDPAKAEALMKEAGWSRGEDGIFQKGGERFSITLVAPSSEPERQDLAVLVAEQLRRTGFDVKVQVKDFASFNIQEVSSFLLGLGYPGDPDDDLYQYFSSDLGFSGMNYSGYKNEKVDSLLKKAREEIDPDKRKVLYQDIQREMIEDPPLNYLVYLQHIYAVRKGFSGFMPRVLGHGSSPLWNIEEWDRGDAAS